jgi:hypothetical protein
MGYEFWQASLGGSTPPMHEGDPQPGFYRKRVSRGGAFVPVAIWVQDGRLVALVDGVAADAADIWTYVCDKPVTEEAYRERVATGRWQDEDAHIAASLAPPAPGHNNPPQDEAEILKGQIEAASAGATEYAEIQDDATASKAQSLRSRLLELSGTADKKREAEKKPHLEAGKTIDAKWQPLVKAAKTAADAIRTALSDHETRKARAAEAERRADEEARRKALAEQLAKHPEAPADFVAPAPLASPAPAPVTSIKGAYGRAAPVMAVKVATVVDQDAAYGALKTQPELIEVIAKLAQKSVDAGFDIPGVTVEERKVVR